MGGEGFALEMDGMDGWMDWGKREFRSVGARVSCLVRSVVVGLVER